MRNYQRINNVVGWIVFLIATAVYFLTIEPTASWWDCGEFIASSYKLQVGHPPGAPLFLMLGRLFSLFAKDTAHVAQMINRLSALASSFTILFLFWSITAFAKKIAMRDGILNDSKLIAIMGSGIVGALAYTFCDSFWFSAVEGEVYAMSSFFTAIVFWAILKWESISEEQHADRWIILIAYLMGLSIGVHLLNLLTIPALAFVYYFKKFPTTRKGFFLAGIVGVLILVIVQYGIIPGLLVIAGKFELLFVNSLGMPFNTGNIIYILLVVSLIVFGLNYTKKNKQPILNTVILCFTFIIVGYSSFACVVIRSSANPPMDENDPSNVFSLISYLNREQYGDRPLFYGQYYNTPLDIDYDKKQYRYDDGSPYYVTGKVDGKDKYIIADDRRESVPVYDPAFCTYFPRMYSPQKSHISAYKSWADIKGKKIKTERPDNKEGFLVIPTFMENLSFFFKYQMGHMYFRYFMWNFVGRQNDIQGHGSILEGNWISGLKFIDEARLGAMKNLPSEMKHNGAMNKFYFLPLILGLIGMIFHFNSNQKDGFVVFLLFFFTGIAIVLYLNQYPYQPRERDYAYAGSFYAFTFWIGLGVYALYDALSKKLPATITAFLTTALCLIVPAVMAKDGWNDHDRSRRYTARDLASDYLNSCAPNAILFTNGDNDTFPLWYAQDVEGIRTDVRVVNLSLLNTDWYIDQMKRKAYESEPLPISFSQEQYRQGTRDYLPIVDKKIDGFVDIKKVMDFIRSDDPQVKETYGSKSINIIPTKKIGISVDKEAVLANKVVPAKDSAQVLQNVEWSLNKSYILKNDLMVMDILANSGWKRPVYFAVTIGSEGYLNLEDYFQLEGLAYRVVPVKTEDKDGLSGRVNTDVMYDNVMNKFKWGGMSNPKQYIDPETSRLTTGLRLNFAKLANALIKENKKDSAIAVLDKCVLEMPDVTIPYNFLMLTIAEEYHRADAPEKGNKIIKRLAEIYEADLNYYTSLDPAMQKSIESDIQQAESVLGRLLNLAMVYKQKDLSDELEKKLTGIEDLMRKKAPR